MIRSFNRNVPAVFMVFLMIFTMVFSSIAAIPIASADLSQVMTVSLGSGTPGDILQLNITMNDGVGLSAAQFTVNYDSNQFAIDETDGDFDGLADSIVPATGNSLGSPPAAVGFFNGYTNFVMNRTGGVAIPPAAAGVTVNVVGIKFTVKAGAINGTYPITITNLQVFDYDGNEVAIGAPVAGSIIITGGAEAPSSEKAITAFSFASPAATGVITEADHTIAVTVPYETDVTALVPTIVVSADATVSPEGAQDFTNPVTYTVTAQNGSIQNYVVTVNVALPSTNNALANLVLRNASNSSLINMTPAFVTATKSYTAIVPFTTTALTVTPTVADATATVKVNDTAVNSGSASGPINIPIEGINISVVVTAQNGLTDGYTINVTRTAASTAKAITGFSFASPAATGTINEVTKTIAVTVPYGTVLTALKPTITVSPNATVSPASGVAQNFSTPVTYTVTAQNGSTQSYVVTVTKAAASSAKEILTFGINGGTTKINTADKTIEVTVPSGTNVKQLKPTITVSPYATVSPASGVAQNFSTPVTYTVTAQNGSKQEYEVTVTVKLGGSSNNSGGGGSSTFGGTLIKYKDGGNVSDSSLGAKVQIPAYAMDQDFKVKIEKASSSGLNVPDDKKIVGKVIEFTKDLAGNFEKDITITLNFDEDDVDFSKYSLSLYYYNTSSRKWVELEIVKVDKGVGRVTGETDRFGKFALLATAKEEPVKPPVTPPAKPPVTPPVTPPADIAGHWAAGSITKLVNSKAITGYPDNTFRPDNNISRAEFATILVKVFKLSAKDGKVFGDTQKHWAKDSISTAQAYGIINGYSEWSFGPDDNITREQMAVMIVKAAQLKPAESTKNFSDKAQISSWAKAAIDTAVANGIMSGYPDNTFKPLATATRAEAATIFANIMK